MSLVISPCRRPVATACRPQNPGSHTTTIVPLGYHTRTPRVYERTHTSPVTQASEPHSVVQHKQCHTQSRTVRDHGSLWSACSTSTLPPPKSVQVSEKKTEKTIQDQFESLNAVATCCRAGVTCRSLSAYRLMCVACTSNEAAVLLSHT